ncbi:MAG: ankyrin repeat domain-containing protein, partial [Verrucomicrobiota bacterium]|nr:ankyrin repeat domain-containing protein [Verrucomicrobiota bacterium]
MRQVYMILGTSVLVLTFTGLLPAIPPDESISPGDEFSRKAIMVRPPSLLEMMGGKERDLLSLFQLRASAPGAVMENQLAGSLMVSLHGARPPISPGENLQETAVHRAILRGRPDVLGRLLSEESSPDEIHPSGWNPLQLALQRRDQQALKVLLSHGADPRKKGVGALTSLGLALVLESSPAELELLLDAGADPDHI